MAQPHEAAVLPYPDEHYMQLAIEQAQLAYRLGEVPVGCVLVSAEGEVVGRGHNLTITSHDATAHAEVVALREAGQALGNYRLPALQMFVTLEPCIMCVGAIIHSRLQRLVYGAPDPRTGACGSVFSLISSPLHNHALLVEGGVLGEQCAKLLQDFFAERRHKKER
ncbi:MAG: tRNA adenosine(34) deaminase TadA [Succinivibrio sp.]|nr:tRNA adenosine(34) deaminase TadA [Succinivibrio sp.]